MKSNKQTRRKSTPSTRMKKNRNSFRSVSRTNSILLLMKKNRNGFQQRRAFRFVRIFINNDRVCEKIIRSTTIEFYPRRPAPENGLLSSDSHKKQQSALENRLLSSDPQGSEDY